MIQTSITGDPCSSVPCIHGKCTTTSSGGYHCDCQAGYTGAACDTGKLNKKQHNQKLVRGIRNSKAKKLVDQKVY